MVLVLIVVALLAPLLAPHGPKETGFATYVAPGREFPMGTDQVGRDVLSRVIWGARLSLYVGLVSVVFGITLGSLWGVVTGYVGGATDTGSQRLVDCLMALPPIILALSLMAALGQSVNNVILSLVILLTPTAVRTVRAVALGVAATPFIEAAEAAGASRARIVFRHLIPNCMASYIVLVTTNISYAIVVEASLSFIGAGAPPDEPSWGGMLARASRRSKPRRGWYSSPDWPSAWPCSASIYSAIRSATSRIRASAAASASRGSQRSDSDDDEPLETHSPRGPGRRAARHLGLPAGPAGAQEKPRTGGILTWFDYGDPGRLDVHAESPLVVQQATAGHLQRAPAVRSGRARARSSRDLAERWTVSPDGKTYTFHLRKNVKWHDGQPFSSADVKTSFDRVLNPDFKSPKCGAALKPMVASVEAVDPGYRRVQAQVRGRALPARRSRRRGAGWRPSTSWPSTATSTRPRPRSAPGRSSSRSTSAAA